MNLTLKNLLLFCFLIPLFKTSFGQGPTLAKVIPPSPNAQAFQKYGSIPVSPYTGLPTISVPLYDINFRDIHVPISLSYHASGIKVAEEASQVGLGWVINSGGSISRNIVGEDDFNGSTYFNSATNTLVDFSDGQGPRDITSSGCILNMFNRSIPNQPTMYNIDLQSALNSFPVFDFQPDQYFYNFLNQSGKFILKRNKQAIIEKQEKIQITCTATDGSTWQVKTTDGYTYDFAANEKYHEMSDHFSAWYLTKITSPKGNIVTFNYTVVPRYVQTAGGYSESWDYANPPVQAGSFLEYYTSPYTGHQAGSIPGKDYTLVVLDNIDFNTGIVKFNYSDRLDISGDKKLDSLSVFSKDKAGVVATTPLKTVVLNYDYFDHGDFDDDAGNGNSKRLKLLSVQKKGTYNGVTMTENPYSFTYNESVWLPSKGSFARDHWGYYNGKTSNTSLIPSVISVNSPDMITSAIGMQGTERDAVGSQIGAYSLATIQYPTGGSTEFQFEGNDFDEQQSQVNDASYFNKAYSIVQQTKTVIYDNQSHLFNPSDTLDLTDAYFFNANPLTPNSTPIGMDIVIRFSDYSTCTNVPYPFPTTDKVTFDIYDITGTTLIMHKDASYFPTCSGGNTDGCMVCGGPAFTYSMSNTGLVKAKYLIRAHIDNSYSASIQDVRFNLKYYAQVSSLPDYSNSNTYTYSGGGGQRVVRIIDHDGISPANINVKKFVYHYFADKNNSGTSKEYSFGRRMSHPVYNYFIVNNVVVRHSVSGGYQISPFNAPMLMRISDSDIPLNGSAGGAVVGYDQVTVLNGENGENGKAVYNYVNVPDHVNPYSDPYFHLPVRPPYGSNLAETLNGALLKQEDFVNKQGQFLIAKRVTNTYENVFTNDNVVYGLENRVQPHIEVTDGATVTGGSNPCERDLLTFVSLKSQFKPLTKTIAREFSQNDTTRYTADTTNYYYDNYQHLQPTRIVTTNSKGELITTINKYPLDYTITGTVTNPVAIGIKNLINKNMVLPVIEKYTQRSKSDGTNVRVLSSLFNSYKATVPIPDTIQAINSVVPITNFSASNITSSSALLDSRYQKYVVFDQYDLNGNLLQQHKQNGTSITYIWDYNSTVPIAEVINATATDVAYTSFEFDGTGNWAIGSSIRDNATAAKTGKVSYYLANGNITKNGLTAATTYVVSYWSNSTTPLTITGTISGYPVNGATAKGWTYHEHRVTGVTTVTVSGTGNIDELRLYPVNAQISTYTYDPLVGITSSTDGKGLTTYYEYDPLQRLINIKDKDGNIVKHTDYHFQGQ
jgi:YD repeat-containing protein